MPSTANQTTIKLYGTNTVNRVPTANTLSARELFINTYNSYNVSTATITSGGTNYSSNDIGKVCTVTFSGGTQVQPLRIVIQAVTSGVITQIGVVDYGEFTTPPGTLLGTINVPSTSGSGATTTVTFFTNPTIEVGGGLYVGDSTDAPGEVVQVTGSLAAQDHNAVNITGGNISGVNLTGVTIASSSSAPAVLTNPTINNPTITGGTISGATITGGSVGTSGSFLPSAYITALHVPNTTPPAGIQGVLVLGADGIVYVTNNPTINSLTTTSNITVRGALAVGSTINPGSLGTIKGQGDVTAFATS
jgi:hypothetical protein